MFSVSKLGNSTYYTLGNWKCVVYVKGESITILPHWYSEEELNALNLLLIELGYDIEVHMLTMNSGRKCVYAITDTVRDYTKIEKRYFIVQEQLKLYHCELKTHP